MDGETLDSFAMDRIGDDVKKSENPLDEVIEEMKHFKPYGKYFK